jgi:hypothetical protein
VKLKDVKPGRWYETTRGVGRCLAAGGTHPPSAQFDIVAPFPQGKVYVSPRDVLLEVPDPTAPRQQEGPGDG